MEQKDKLTLEALKYLLGDKLMYKDLKEDLIKEIDELLNPKKEDFKEIKETLRER